MKWISRTVLCIDLIDKLSVEEGGVEDRARTGDRARRGSPSDGVELFWPSSIIRRDRLSEENWRRMDSPAIYTPSAAK